MWLGFSAARGVLIQAQKPIRQNLAQLFIRKFEKLRIGVARTFRPFVTSRFNPGLKLDVVTLGNCEEAYSARTGHFGRAWPNPCGISVATLKVSRLLGSFDLRLQIGGVFSPDHKQIATVGVFTLGIQFDDSVTQASVRAPNHAELSSG
jgi:hypothetical protein